MSFVTKVQKSIGSNTLFLAIFPFPGRRKAWYFIRVHPAKVRCFRKNVMSGPVDLREYGEVLRRGWGENPPEKVTAEMKEVYGYNPE